MMDQTFGKIKNAKVTELVSQSAAGALQLQNLRPSTAPAPKASASERVIAHCDSQLLQPSNTSEANQPKIAAPPRQPARQGSPLTPVVLQLQPHDASAAITPRTAGLIPHFARQLMPHEGHALVQIESQLQPLSTSAANASNADFAEPRTPLMTRQHVRPSSPPPLFENDLQGFDQEDSYGETPEQCQFSDNFFGFQNTSLYDQDDELQNEGIEVICIESQDFPVQVSTITNSATTATPLIDGSFASTIDLSAASTVVPISSTDSAAHNSETNLGAPNNLVGCKRAKRIHAHEKESKRIRAEVEKLQQFQKSLLAECLEAAKSATERSLKNFTAKLSREWRAVLGTNTIADVPEQDELEKVQHESECEESNVNDEIVQHISPCPWMDSDIFSG
jgi:hypothetical protein